MATIGVKGLKSKAFGNCNGGYPWRRGYSKPRGNAFTLQCSEGPLHWVKFHIESTLVLPDMPRA